MNAVKSSVVSLLILSLLSSTGFGDPYCPKPELYDECVWSRPLKVSWHDKYHYVELGQWRYIERLNIETRSDRGGSVEVFVNGIRKGTLRVHDYYSTQTIYVQDTAHTIEFRHCSGGEVTVSDIRALQARPLQWKPEITYVPPPAYPPVVVGVPVVIEPGAVARPYPGSPGGGFGLRPQNEATAVAQETLMVTLELMKDADPETEQIPYLLPVRRLAGKVESLGIGAGAQFEETLTAELALAAQIAACEPYIEFKKKNPNTKTFELVVQLDSIRIKIERALGKKAVPVVPVHALPAPPADPEKK